ncbi:hypothetical protein LZZ85_18015 [Terrimonas sp. NA20]|uniref:Haem-binding uptake Tiki superfamily ChaN domain-containing protein n=1 Tax=Terrimonas ginsenosidimutans TaxID=2908004 RepID=A0ABS9KV15_9BACT|nr:hypothetical protein [Terrimonas ginsenosidimutans]MCG2616199.1 hypothetical protein [Terrimonas ginsenosidimutans]
MKHLLFPLLLFISFCSSAQAKKKLSDQDKLNNCISTHTQYFTFNDENPSGNAWDTLKSLFEKNEFVAWGEYHNSPLLSRLTALAMAAASKHGYRTLCVETSPFVASELMRISRTNSPSNTLEKIFNAGYPGIGTLPFFRTKEDAQILHAADKLKYDIWGIDQEFQMAFSYGIKKVYDAQSLKTRTRFQPLVDSLLARWWYPDTKLIDSLKNAIRHKKLKSILDDIRISKEIYRDGDNEGRAMLMKKNFFRYYNKSPNSKVFFKMGSNHLAKGINLQTNVYDIGNAVYELAQRSGRNFTNVYIMVRYTTEKGQLIDDFYCENNENPKVFSGLYDQSKWVLVDIRSLRTRLNYDNSLSRDAYAVIEKYDYVLVSPEVMQ